MLRVQHLRVRLLRAACHPKGPSVLGMAGCGVRQVKSMTTPRRSGLASSRRTTSRAGRRCWPRRKPFLRAAPAPGRMHRSITAGTRGKTSSVRGRRTQAAFRSSQRGIRSPSRAGSPAPMAPSLHGCRRRPVRLQATARAGRRAFDLCRRSRSSIASPTFRLEAECGESGARARRVKQAVLEIQICKVRHYSFAGAGTFPAGP